MKKITYLFILFVFFYSCDKEADVDFVSYEPKIVVEGIIENGSYPSVLLSVSASIPGPKDTLSLLNHVIKSAKVTVSNGEKTEILMLQTNNNKMPPYEYKGREIKGEAGKTYFLQIEYGGKNITSSTTIPELVVLDDIWFKKNYPGDTIGYIYVSFKNQSEEFYQISTSRYLKDKNFTPCLYGNIDSKVYPKNEQVSMQVNKGPVLYPKTDYKTYFKTKDTIMLKFSTQTKESYKFWNSYQNELLNAQNPIFPANTSLYSNIKGGAIGIWSGMSSQVYFVIPESINR